MPYLHNWKLTKIVGDPGPSIGCPNLGLHYVPIRAGVPATSKNGLFETTQMSSKHLFYFVYHINKVKPVYLYLKNPCKDLALLDINKYLFMITPMAIIVFIQKVLLVLGTHKLGPFEFLEASDHTIVQQ